MQAQLDLAGADGMNHYAAAAIMSQVSMDDFLNMSAQERLHCFASVVGEDRIVSKFHDFFVLHITD